MAQQCFARGNEVFKTGDYNYAIKLFKQSCKFVPDQLVYRQHLRAAAKKKFNNNKRGSRLAAVTTVGTRASLKAAKAKKDFYRALECCEDILSENPWDPGVLLDMAEIFEQLNLLEHAVWCADGAMERDPNDPTVNRACAKFYEKHGDFTKAINCWERVKKARPADQEADRKMKDLAASDTIDRGRYEGAESFTRAIADKAKTQELLDETKGGAGETRFAHQLSELQVRIAKEPTELPAYLQLSQLYRRQAKLDEARAIMEKARDATGGHPDALAELAEIEIDRLKGELAVAKRQASEKPGEAAAQKAVLEIARALNEFELREFQRRVERMPTDLNLRVELGIRLTRAGQFDQAITELQKARSAPGRKADALIWIGHSFRAKKNPRMAKRHYEEALEAVGAADPDVLKELRYLLGRVSEDMGDKPTAVQHYEEVAAIDYGYRDVAQRLDALSGALNAAGTAQDSSA
jgi:tetratricopeptide (TPR) repeat protein